MQIIINDKFVQENEAQIGVFSEALMYGFGVFETLRTYPGKKILKLDAHTSRLVTSAKAIELKLDFDLDAIQNMVINVVQKSEFELQRIKILAIPDSLIVISNELKIDENIYDGVSLKTSIQKRSLPEIKSISHLECLINYKQAVRQGFFDALLIDEFEYFYECTRSNIFWIEKGKLYTRQNNVLPGITRNIIKEISHLPFEYKNGKLSQLLEADEIFITNSIIGVVPVIKVDDAYISLSQPGNETTKIMKTI